MVTEQIQEVVEGIVKVSSQTVVRNTLQLFGHHRNSVSVAMVVPGKTFERGLKADTSSSLLQKQLLHEL